MNVRSFTAAGTALDRIGIRIIGRILGLGLALAIIGANAGCPPITITPRPAGTTAALAGRSPSRSPRSPPSPATPSFAPSSAPPYRLDGRIPANTGSWSFVAWSPTHSTIQVTVDANGAASTTTRTEAAPGPGIQVPLPASWADSIQVFAATNGHRDPGASIANLVVLNLASYSQAPHKAVWASTSTRGKTS